MSSRATLIINCSTLSLAFSISFVAFSNAFAIRRISFCSCVAACGVFFCACCLWLLVDVVAEPGWRRIGIFMLVFEFSREILGVLAALDWLLPLTELARELLLLKPVPVRFAVLLSRGVKVRADWLRDCVAFVLLTFRTEADFETTGRLSFDFLTEPRTSVVDDVTFLRMDDLGSFALKLVARTKFEFFSSCGCGDAFVVTVFGRLYSEADRLMLCRVLVVL